MTTIPQADIPTLIAQAEIEGKRHIIPALQAANSNKIALFLVSRRAPVAMFKRWLATPYQRPRLVVLGDDDHMSTGPEGFPTAAKALGWARWGMLHAARGEPEHYADAVAATLQHKRVVLVETDTAHTEAWGRLMHRNQVANAAVLMRPGVPHPVLPGRLQ